MKTVAIQHKHTARVQLHEAPYRRLGLGATCPPAAVLVPDPQLHRQSEEQVAGVGRVGDLFLLAATGWSNAAPERPARFLGNRQQFAGAALSRPPQRVCTQFRVGVLHSPDPRPWLLPDRDESIAIHPHRASHRGLRCGSTPPRLPGAVSLARTVPSQLISSVEQSLHEAGAEPRGHGLGLHHVRVAASRFYRSEVRSVRTKNVHHALPVVPVIHRAYHQPKSVDFNSVRHTQARLPLWRNAATHPRRRHLPEATRDSAASRRRRGTDRPPSLGKSYDPAKHPPLPGVIGRLVSANRSARANISLSEQILGHPLCCFQNGATRWLRNFQIVDEPRAVYLDGKQSPFVGAPPPDVGGIRATRDGQGHTVQRGFVFVVHDAFATDDPTEFASSRVAAQVHATACVSLLEGTP